MNKYTPIILTKEQLQAALTEPAWSIDRIRAEIDRVIFEQQQRELEWLRKLTPPAPRSAVVEDLARRGKITPEDARQLMEMPQLDLPPVDPLDAVIDGVTLRTLLDGDELNRRETSSYWRAKRMTPAQRAAVSAHWSAQLRAKVAASEVEHRTVVVDTQDEP